MTQLAAALSVDGIHLWRGARHVLRGVSLSMHAGDLLHVVGENGAGKTTLLRVMCGLMVPELGAVAWCGQPLQRVRDDFYSQLAYAAHDTALKADLTAFENLQFSVGLRRHVSEAELLSAMRKTDSDAYAHLPARVLSAGQRRRVSMARVLALRAHVWLLDEPFSNLDSRGVELFSALIAEHTAQGGMAAIVAHHGLAGAAQFELAA